MKIAIVCGHFIPKMGYIEVHLANNLADAGHKVLVITSTEVPKYVQHLISEDFIGGEEISGSLVIKRLKPSFSMGQMVKAKGVKKEILNFSPELVISIGLGKLFPQPVFEISDPQFRIVTLLGDNEETYAVGNNWQNLKNYILRQKFKRSVYRKAIAQSDRLISYTPATFKILAEFVPAEEMKVLKNKHSEISLGFSPEEFFFDEELRKQKRSELGIPENLKVIITATRISPVKELEKLPEFLKEVKTPFLFILLGLENNPYGEIVKTAFASHLPKSAYLLKAFAKREDLNAWYNAADFAFFNTAAISNFEALGTGLPLILPNQLNLSRILSADLNGEYYEKPNPAKVIDRVLENYETNAQARSEREEFAKSGFSWPRITERIIELALSPSL